ncbi:MAG: DUF2934 domain-containing protein [Candidatus Omnitrophica bacterium]|nr:DUF2934 domain-containing protein [Candidatus Omnitrophota bacterium]
MAVKKAQTKTSAAKKTTTKASSAKKSTAKKSTTAKKKPALRSAKKLTDPKEPAKKAAVKKNAVKKVPKTSKKPTLTPEEFFQQVSQKAFEIFERRGFIHGQEYFDWTVAEDLVRAETAANLSAKKVGEEELNRRIEQKAFELFERRGYQHGSDQLDWLLAKELIEKGQ